MKIFLLVVILFVLWIPVLQQKFKVINRKDQLFGYYFPAKDTCLTGKNWLSGTYQETTNAFLNQNFGFRNLLVKMNNQIDYSVFDQVHENDCVKGKNNWLFSRGFYNVYSGNNYDGEKHVDSVFSDLERLNQFLRDKNEKLLVCFAPCKESFFPEFLPDDHLKTIKPKSYYSEYKKRLKGSNIPFLDFNSYFQQLKKTSKYPLFAKGAVHWTTYGAYIALDSLLKKIAFEIDKKVNLIKFKSIEVSDTARDSDDDMLKTLNIFENVNTKKFGYPVYENVFKEDSCYKPKVLVIGDSFFYGLNNTWIPLGVFSKESYFLYYFRNAIPFDSKKTDTEVKNLNFDKELKNTDIVILFFTIGNLGKFPYSAVTVMDKK